MAKSHTAIHLHDLAVTKRLQDIYHRLFASIGDLHWWPAKNREEVIIGAILVQNVSWKNVERAIERLRENGLLSLPAIYRADEDVISPCIQSTRYYKMKAKKLKAFAAFVVEMYEGNLDILFAETLPNLRKKLLAIYGIGPETADDIILYAAEKPTFVIDAYTIRIFHRLGLTEEDVSYETFRQWFMEHLPESVPLYNQYHAMIDWLGHHYCLSRNPNCSLCPLAMQCHYSLGSEGASTSESAI